MSYYKDKKEILNKIQRIVNLMKTGKVKAISITKLIMDLSLQYELSEKTVLERLHRTCILDPRFKIEEDEFSYDENRTRNK